MIRDLMLTDDDFFGGMLSSVFAPLSFMKTDIRETDDAILIDIDVPGAKKEDIKINFKNSVLTIETKKEDTVEKKKDGRVILSERSSNTNSRSFRLPSYVKASDINAKYENGVLCLTITKTPEAKGSDIDIS